MFYDNISRIAIKRQGKLEFTARKSSGTILQTLFLLAKNHPLLVE